MPQKAKLREATVLIKAYDSHGHVIAQHDQFGRRDPVIQLLEFVTNINGMYPTVTRYEMTIAY